MCSTHELGAHAGTNRTPATPQPWEIRQGHWSQLLRVEDLLPYARWVANQAELRRSNAGFVGYGQTRPGDRALVAVTNHYDPAVVEAIARALREKGARVDVVTADVGPDREFAETDEIQVAIRTAHWSENPRQWDFWPWVTEMALRRRYDLVVHGSAGPIPQTPFRFESIPWRQQDQLASPATVYPRDLLALINEKTWGAIYGEGRNGRMHLTDPEGTDLTYTLWEEYFTDAYAMGPIPKWGHLMGHPVTPVLPKEDASGVVAGTTNHFSRAFPRIEVHVDHGRVVDVRGGNLYGDAWRQLANETDNLQYPCFPRPGLFWLWELAIGTHPKIARARTIGRHSSGGFEYERLRSGVIHCGFGTFWCAPEEEWAAARGLPYGHLHVHLNFPTLTLTTAKGKEIPLIRQGRLLALDDPEVRAGAAKYGDPDALLAEDWVPPVPGISVPGEYADYARNPGAWVYRPGTGS